MALINSFDKTKLRSLKYGGDRPGNGNSGQPYIQSKIPEEYSTKSLDFLLRAPKNTANDVVRLGKMFFDLKSPNGLLFTVKQNLLSRTAVPAQGGTRQAPRLLNERIYTPLSTLAQAGVVAFGGHLNKQGIDPFAGTGAYAKNPNLYFDKAKVSNLSDNNYIRTEQVTPLHKLILLLLDTTGTQTTTITSVDFQNRLANLWYNKIEQETEGAERINILSYTGGPGSILGIGKTNIKFADQRTGINNDKIAGGYSGSATWTPNPSEQNIPSRSRNFSDIIIHKATGVTDKYYQSTNKSIDFLLLYPKPTDGNYVYVSGSEVGLNAKLFNLNATGSVTWTPKHEIARKFNTIQSTESFTRASMAFVNRQEGDPTQIIKPLIDPTSFDDNRYVYVSGSFVSKPNFSLQNTYTFNQTQIISQSKNNFGSPSLRDFRTTLLKDTSSLKSSDARYIMSFAPKYDEKNIDSPNYIYMNSAGKRGDKSSYTKGKDKDNIKNIIDKITGTSILVNSSNIILVNSSNISDDLCRFYIKFLNSDKFIQFRAYLDNISDNYNPNWNSFKYPGRADSFYTYEGFDRKLTLGWSIVALSKGELKHMYEKLNYLASATTAEYSNNGYMKGVLTQLTIGNYIKELPGFINNLVYEISNDTTWEIGIDDDGKFNNTEQLPHMIKVNMGYTPIPTQLATFKVEPNNTPKFINMS
jgi:hypothetical protein